MLNEIGETSLNQLLVRRLTTPGGTLAPSVAPEIFPVLVVQGDTPDLAWLKDERLCGCGGSIAAGGAGTNASLSLLNPIGSNQIVTLERIRIVVAAGSYQAFVSATALAGALAVVTCGFRDSRAYGPTATAPAPRPTAQVTTDNTGALSALPVIWQSSDNAVLEIPAVLAPGRSFQVFCATAVTAMTAFALMWRERRAQPGELV